MEGPVRVSTSSSSWRGSLRRCGAAAAAISASSALGREVASFALQVQLPLARPNRASGATVLEPAAASAAAAPAGRAGLVGSAFAMGMAAAAGAKLVGQRRSAAVSQRLLAAAASTEVVGVEAAFNDGAARPAGVEPQANVSKADDLDETVKRPRTLLEGSKEVKLDGPRPSGQSADPDKMYWWKMSKDKRTIDVIFPVDDDVKGEDVIFRLGQDPEEKIRGPTLEMGWRYKDETGKKCERLVIDGQILNAIRREDTLWTLEEMAGTKVCVLTLVRPSMLRKRYDPILAKETEEERIEPQTWDALLLEERLKPEITDRVYFDISLKGEPAGRLEFGLFGDVLPKTVRNFKGLVTGTYEKDDGSTMESVFTYKGMKLDNVLPEFLISAGNPGLDCLPVKFTAEELEEYFNNFKDVRPKKVGPVEDTWCIRWGADLGNPEQDGQMMEDGAKVDGNSDEQFHVITETLRELVAKGEGASLIFFRPEFEKGVGANGRTFPAENFKVSHGGRGFLSMDRAEDEDIQGSCFFITLKEFPEMDKRWVTFGKLLAGEELLDTIEQKYETRAKKVVIEDCGLIA